MPNLRTDLQKTNAHVSYYAPLYFLQISTNLEHLEHYL